MLRATVPTGPAPVPYDFTWAFVLHGAPDGDSTRLVVRESYRYLRVWAPPSVWSTSAVGLTALAWTSIILFTGIGLRSTVRYFPSYRPWMYLVAAALFAVVHTLPMVIIWAWFY